jgi:hypothetical protein
VLALGCCAFAAHVHGVDVTVSTGPSGTLLERLRARSGSDDGAGVAAVDAEARQRERLELLAQGEAALAAADAETALRHFERAAMMRHAADSEMALIRTYMQAGHYRRALAFGAHTAGAHRDYAGAPALYAWLLFLGGQGAAARQLFEGAAARAPGDPAFQYVQAALLTNVPPATGLPIVPPLRLAPYAAMVQVPSRAVAVASGTLVDGGRRAVIPSGMLPAGSAVWIRNGLGEVSPARIERRLDRAGASLVRLDHALPVPDDLGVASRDPFPGSIVYAVDYATMSVATPAWPLLHPGFAGQPLDGGGRALGIELPPGPRGGPVFDAQGRLAGVALPGRRGPDRLLLPSQLAKYAVPLRVVAPADGTASRMSVDEIYERAMRVSVQALAVR